MVSELRSYSGYAKFSFIDDLEKNVDTAFTIKFFSNSQVLISIRIPWLKIFLDTLEFPTRNIARLKMEGYVEIPENTIKIDELRKYSSRIEDGKPTIDFTFEARSPVEILFGSQSDIYSIRLGLTNCIFTGCRYTRSGNYAYLDEFEINIGSQSVIFKQVSGYSQLEKLLSEKSSIEVTSEARILSSQQNKVNDIHFVEDLVTLVSLATGIEISIIFHDYFFGDRLIKTVFFPKFTEPYSGNWEIIQIRDPVSCNLKHFLETGYSQYVLHKENLGLEIFFFYKKRSEQLLITELKFLIGVTALETICGHFEKYQKTQGTPISCQSIDNCKNKIREILAADMDTLSDQKIDAIAKSCASNNPALKLKLKTLLDKFSIKYDGDDLKIIDIRNKIIHYGKFPPEINEFTECDRLSDLLSRIILSILKYDREYISRINGFRKSPLT